MEKYKKSWQFHGRTITVENGEIAKQAGGSVLVRYDDTVVLSTATASHEAKDTDFFPLTVVYQEKMYAAGKIPGGFLRREGRPTEHATLTARLIDRPIRPLFAEGFRNEVLYSPAIRTAPMRWHLCSVLPWHSACPTFRSMDR